MVTVSRYDILRFIIKYKKEHDGNSPTMRQICDELDIASTNTVSYCLDELEASGKIRRPQDGGARGIEVVGGRWTREP